MSESLTLLFLSLSNLANIHKNKTIFFMILKMLQFYASVNVHNRRIMLELTARYSVIA